MEKNLCLEKVEQQEKKKLSLSKWMTEHDTVASALIVIIGVIITLAISMSLFYNPITEQQFQYLENVATSVYASGANNIPNDVDINFGQELCVSFKQINLQGCVHITSQNGSIKIARDNQIELIIFFAFFVVLISATFLYPLSISIIYNVIDLEYRKKTRKNTHV